MNLLIVKITRIIDHAGTPHYTMHTRDRSINENIAEDQIPRSAITALGSERWGHFYGAPDDSGRIIIGAKVTGEVW